MERPPSCPGCGARFAPASQACRRCGTVIGDDPVPVETADAILNPGDVIGGYVVDAYLARGGMGVVYRAREEELRRFVALKVISPAISADGEFRERFRRESYLAARIEAPGIVPIYRAGEDRGHLFIAMRLVPGTDLATLLAEQGALPARRAVDVIGQLARSLDAAHAEGLIHRDVKPANVLLESDRAYLTDFGLTIDTAAADPALTAAGGWIGTAAYAAPEQISGGAVDARADVYALGGVLHHCLTGAAPFPASGQIQAIAAHMTKPPPRPSAVGTGVPEAFDAVVARAMAKDADTRFQSAGELAVAARAALRPPMSPELAGLEAALLSGDSPIRSAPLLGREDDVATAQELLAQPRVRLLTLTGPGGVGKTRLALELLQRAGAAFADGARVVSLAGIGDPSRVLATLAQALGVTENEGRPPLAALTALLAERELLILVDNFEQVLAAAPELPRLLAGAPRIKLVVTSRGALRVAGEHELPVPPLPLPAAADLFVHRARALNPRLELPAGDRARIERICDHLDGLPLAVELAAGRSKILTPAAMLARLERRLDLLAAGPRDAPRRHQTLRATIAWSHDLLEPDAQQLFAELSVFVGGFTLELAEEVCGVDALDGIAAMVDQSLITAGGGRLAMFDTVRDFAREHLDQRPDAGSVRRRHARAYAAVAERAELGLQGPEVATWLERLDAEHANLRAAIGFALEDGDAETALAVCAGLWNFWMLRGNLTEGRAYADAALALPGGPPNLRMRASRGAGVLAAEQGEFDAARTLFERSLELASARGESDHAARAHGNLGILAHYAGDQAEAIRRYGAAKDILRAIGDERGIALMTVNLGVAHTSDTARAVELLTDGAARARRVGDPGLLASALRGLARVLAADVDSQSRAVPLLRESLDLARDLDDRPGLVESFETLAAIAGRRGDPSAGALLIGAAEGLRAAAGAIAGPDESAWLAKTETELRQALGDAEYAASVDAGRRLSLDDAFARALAVDG